MILIAFENGAFPLAKQYPSKDADHSWKEDRLDSTYIIPEKKSSVKRK